MDTAAFIVALLVIVAVGYWYVENELKASDGAHGLFAVRQTEKARKTRLPRFSEGAARYRARGAGADGSAGSISGRDPERPPVAEPKYRAKERAWHRAAKLDEE